MSRFTKTGVILLAVAGVLSFSSPFDNGQVFAQTTSAQGKPAPSATPVNVMNTPLPVNVMNTGTAQAIPVTTSEPRRDLIQFGIPPQNQLNVTYTVTLPANAVLEMVSAVGGGVNGGTLIIWQARNGLPAGVSITPMSGSPVPWTSGGNSNVLSFPFEIDQEFGSILRPTAVNAQIQNTFEVTILGNGISLTCDVSLGVRYVQ